MEVRRVPQHDASPVIVVSQAATILPVMLPTLLFALLAGLLTILSPCVLPVVPLLVGAATGPGGTADRGGRRVAGIILGFGATFIAATVLLASTLAAAGVTTSQLRVASAILLVAFGATLAVPALGRGVERWASRATVPWAPAMRPGAGGFGSGLVLGASIGLIWSPCVGPIMASVIATAVSVGPTAEAVLISLAFVVGASVPLAAIALGGRRAAQRLGSAERRSGLVRAFGGLTMAAGLLVVTGLDVPLQARVAALVPPALAEAIAAAEPGAGRGDAGTAPEKPSGTTLAPLLNVDGRPLPEPIADSLPASVPLEDLGPAPELTGITDWINSDPLTLATLRGKVVLVHFWTFGCINCIHVQPYVKAWFERYADAGFVVIGVHSPELSYEREIDNVRDAVAKAEVTFPVAFDPAFDTWHAYENWYWPAFYLVDREGRIRHVAAGEGGYDTREQVIRELLAGA